MLEIDLSMFVAPQIGCAEHSSCSSEERSYMYKNILILITSVAAFLFALGALAQAPQAAFVTHQLRPNVYYIEGGGGHSGVIVGDNGVIVIDAKTTPAGGKELLEI